MDSKKPARKAPKSFSDILSTWHEAKDTQKNGSSNSDIAATPQMTNNVDKLFFDWATNTRSQ